MTPQDLEAIRARWAKEAMGQWRIHSIAAAPTDIQALLAHVAALEGEVERMRADVALMRAAGIASNALDGARSAEEYTPLFVASSAATDALWARCDALAAREEG